MASLLLRRPALAAGLGLSSVLAADTLLRPQRYRLLCDSSSYAPAASRDWSFQSYAQEAKTPVVTRDGRWNARALRQISMGSILGLVGGVAVSTFSRSLALLIGLLVFGVQYIESRGIHIIPYNRMERYFTNVNLRSAILDNVAFKLSFGATFALAAFAEF